MRVPVFGVIVLATLAGCGGSDSEGDDFVRRLDALCKVTNPELAEINTALTEARDAGRAGRVSVPETLDTFATLLRRAEETTGRFEARLRAMEVPKGERAFHDDLLDSVEKGSSNLGRQVNAAEARDAVRLRDLSVAGSEINARGKGLIAGHGGFRYCGRG